TAALSQPQVARRHPDGHTNHSMVPKLVLRSSSLQELLLRGLAAPEGYRLRRRAVPGLRNDRRAFGKIQAGVCAKRSVSERDSMLETGKLRGGRRDVAGHSSDFSRR